MATLDPFMYKYLFIATYFDIPEDELVDVPNEATAFIRLYLETPNELSEDFCTSYTSFLKRINLSHLHTPVTGTHNYKFVKPQFKYTYKRQPWNILSYDQTFVLENGVPVYATNFFVDSENVSTILIRLARVLKKLFPDSYHVTTERSTVMGGKDGYIFAPSYIDWLGIEYCYNADVSFSALRLYLIGDTLANHFTQKNYTLTGCCFRNFYKGLALKRHTNNIVLSRVVNTSSFEAISDLVRDELDGGFSYVKYIQRDYIYDATFPDDISEELLKYITVTSIYKEILPFRNKNVAPPHVECVIDRYACNKVRVATVQKKKIPLSRTHLCYYIDENFYQIKGLPNAFLYLENDNKVTFMILANSCLFGSKKVYEMNDFYITYRTGGWGVDNKIYKVKNDIYLLETKLQPPLRSDVPVYVLIRGPFEHYLDLSQLQNPWVENTLLKTLFTLLDR